MASKKKKRIRQNLDYTGDSKGRALSELHNMKHRDLQSACCLRGLPPKDVIGFDHYALVKWFIDNYDNSQNDTLLVELDAYIEKELEAKGYKKGESLLSPALKWARPGNIEEMDKPKTIKPNKESSPEKEKKPKAQVDKQTGVRSGTKKALTYQLTMDGEDIAIIIKKVKASFPEAEDKSIKIWNKRKLKEMAG